jgi:HEAT repeat protein
VVAALVVALMVVIGLFLWSGRGGARDPIHEERRLSDWVLDLNSPSLEVRGRSERVLRAMNPAAAVDGLLGLLEQPDSRWRSVLERPKPRLPDRFRRWVMSRFRPYRSLEVRRATIPILSWYGTNVPADRLGVVLRDSDGNVAGGASLLLGKMGPDAVPVLREALQDTRPLVRRFALSSLNQLGPVAAPAATDVAALVNEPELGPSATLVLMRIGPAALPVVIELYEKGGALERLRAVQALHAMGWRGTEARGWLMRAARDQDPAVRCVAVSGLGRIRPFGGAVEEALRAALLDSDAGVRAAGALAAGAAGSGAAALLPELLRLTADANPEVRSNALASANRIGQVESRQ